MANRHGALDLMRISGAAIVVAHHFPKIVGGFAPASAHLCVDLFFMLSGFVVASSYEQQLQDRGAAWPFIRDRLVRFWPLHTLALAIGAVLAVVAIAGNRQYMSVSQPFMTLLPGLLFLPAGAGFAFALNPPAWSLSFEVAANAIYAAAARNLTTRTLALAVIAAAIVFAAVVIDTGTADVGADRVTLLSGFARVAFDFACGVLLTRIGARRNVPRELVGALVAAAIAMPIFRLGAGGLYDLVFVGAVAPAAIWLAASANSRTAWLRPVVRYTFPAYILHYPLLFAGEHGLSALGVTNPVAIATCLITTLCAGCWAGARFAASAQQGWVEYERGHSAGGALPAANLKSPSVS